MDSPRITDAKGHIGDEDGLFWFSHFTQEYEVVKKITGKRKFLIMEDRPVIKLDWDNCTISIARDLASNWFGEIFCEEQHEPK